MTNDLEAIDEQLRQALDPLVCDSCERELRSGDAVTLDGSTYCYAHAGERALLFLLDFLFPGYEPEELRAHRYQEAREVLRLVLARVDERMREAAAPDARGVAP